MKVTEKDRKQNLGGYTIINCIRSTIQAESTLQNGQSMLSINVFSSHYAFLNFNSLNIPTCTSINADVVLLFFFRCVCLCVEATNTFTILFFSQFTIVFFQFTIRVFSVYNWVFFQFTIVFFFSLPHGFFPVYNRVLRLNVRAANILVDITQLYFFLSFPASFVLSTF